MGMFTHNVHLLMVLVVFQVLSEVEITHKLEHEAKWVFKGGVHPSEPHKAPVTVVEVVAG